MSTQDDGPRAGSTQYLLGEISARLAGMQSMLERLTFRLDNIEQRVETLEKNDGRQATWLSFVEKGVWAGMAAIAALLAKSAGLV